MALIGKLEEFDTVHGDVDTYFDRLNSFFAANDVTDNGKKVHTFISVAGEKTYKLLKAIVAPQKPTEKTIDEIKTALKTHLQPTETLVSRRSKFYKRTQGQNETIADFAAALQELAADSNFGDFLNQALRDIFIIGLRDIDTQRKLRSEKDISFKKALETALARETLSRELTGRGMPIEAVHQVSAGGQKGPQNRQRLGHS